ncbi:MAG: sirohydrochlorin chelatase [Arthrobacter sp.]|uniref:sirohydrochlorin chelatase n=1 Tax=unclassified Arthrobacter TaxID=235627 RepID=UPI002653D3AA|nr:sirohydrochlorin cobaltochelatase [Micrococcaceae bacterium]MDN5824175.1 sirohydrochlorin cobaltochelatase [Micrococcaceae bacterium]MDN5880300.1 sirohydrochlorin cobaltochelatase [Micrococcaceae bacterium]MDN5886646.1 sirohydrochlorin cobaltochelatase [Micrococcaceae bacterium]MDN5904995.1 sirohydrochlorin cobaltochelatase [Micrococcaceae bacterium]
MRRPLHVIACAHGTDDPRGRQLIDQLRAQVAGLVDDQHAEDGWSVQVHEAYVDVQDPDLPRVLGQLPDGEAAVVLPLLLSLGIHTGVDVAEAVASRTNTIAAEPIGADPRLAGVMARRLAEAGWGPDDAVVLASAGTRVPSGQQQARDSAGTLAAALGAPVQAAFCSAADPRVEDAVEQAGRQTPGVRVGVVSYLLAPGFFQERLGGAGANYVTAPLLPDVTIAECVAARLHSALSEADFEAG